MKKLMTVIVSLLCLFGCSDNDSLPESPNSGILFTKEFVNRDFNLDESNPKFSVILELRDIEDIEDLESLNVYVNFVDNTLENGFNSSIEQEIKSFDISDFNTGDNGFQEIEISLSLEEIAAVFNISSQEMAISDQIHIRMDLSFKDGGVISKDDINSNTIIGQNKKSPLFYISNILSNMDSSSYVGSYSFVSTTEGFNSFSFGASGTATISLSEHPNRRIVRLRHSLEDVAGTSPEFKRDYEFTITDRKVLFTEYQISANVSCIPGGFNPQDNGSILLGPHQTQTGTATIDNDETFTIIFVEGYNGIDGECDVIAMPLSIKFEKQE